MTTVTRMARCLGLICALAAQSLFASDIKLTWDPDSDPSVTGYKVYLGTTSGTYGSPFNAGIQTTYTVTGLNAGNYYFAVTAYNSSGQESGYSNEVATTVGGPDTTPPSVAISSPTSSGSYTATGSTLSIGGIASDNVGVVSVSWSNSRGGAGIATGTTSWTVTGIALLSGSNVITVTARDAAGNSAAAVLNVNLAADSTPPSISITSPSTSGSYTATASSLSMAGTAADNVGVTQVSWANSKGGSGTATGTTSWSASGITLVAGTNVITVTAKDAAGNAGTATLNVTYSLDTVAPTVTITTPTSRGTYSTSASSLSLGGTATDNVGVTQVTWSNNRGGSGAATGTTAWSAAVALQSGSNVITVTAKDAAANSSTATLTVTCDPSAPTVSITSPSTSGSYTATASSLSMAGTAADNVGVTQVSWANSKGGSGVATGTTSWSASGITLVAGTNVITVTAKDAVGNAGTATLNVTYSPTDVAPPVISSVVATQISKSSMKIQWTTDENSDSQVEYGATSAYGKSTTLNSSPVTSHSQTISNLNSRTTYHYRVRSRDAAGNLAVSNDATFTLGKRLFSAYPASSLQDSLDAAGNAEYRGVALTNSSASAATLRFTAYDEAGNPISGPGIVNPANRILKPGAQLPVVDTEIFGANAVRPGGWIEVESDVDGVDGLFMLFDSRMTLLDGAGLLSASSDDFVLTEIQERGTNKLNVRNASAEPTDLVFELVKADGTPRASAFRTIAGNGAMQADVFQDLFKEATADATDFLRVKATNDVLPLEIVGTAGGDCSVLSGHQASGGSHTLYSPQYAVGGPWRSTVSVVNLDPVPGSVRLKFIAENGAQIGSMRTLEIAANGKIQISSAEFFGLDGNAEFQGYVQVDAPRVRLTGNVTFGDARRQTFITSLPLVETLQNTLVFGQVASNDLYFTGIALINPDDSDTAADIELLGADGSVQDSVRVTIGSHQRKSGLLTQFFEQIAGKDQTSGYIRVTAEHGIAGFALFGTHSLSVLSAIPPTIVDTH